MIFGVWSPYIQRQLDLSGRVTKMNFAFLGTPYCPLVFSKEIGELGGSRYGGHIVLGIGQDPLASCVVVLNSGGHLTQKDHVVRVSRQLLWGEQSVDEG